MEIELPWPPACLLPNNANGKAWQTAHKAKTKYKGDCKALATYKFTGREGRIPVSITFYPPDKRRRDLDGMLSSIKAGVDGICLAWQIDDVQLRPITLDVGEPVKGGKVIITIGEENEPS